MSESSSCLTFFKCSEFKLTKCIVIKNEYENRNDKSKIRSRVCFRYPLGQDSLDEILNILPFFGSQLRKSKGFCNNENGIEKKGDLLGL